MTAGAANQLKAPHLCCPTTAVSTSDSTGFMIQIPSVGSTKRMMRSVVTGSTGNA